MAVVLLQLLFQFFFAVIWATDFNKVIVCVLAESSEDYLAKLFGKFYII